MDLLKWCLLDFFINHLKMHFEGRKPWMKYILVKKMRIISFHGFVSPKGYIIIAILPPFWRHLSENLCTCPGLLFARVTLWSL